MFKRIGLIALLLSLLTIACAAADGASTVRSYSELLKAVNEYGCTDITISADYKHGTEGVGQSLHGTGTVTIHPEEQGEVTLLGRFDVSGGTLVFERISLQGSPAMTALWVGGGAKVTVQDVTGGESTKAIGGCGVAACGGAEVHVRKATGGYGKSFGGDGVYAYDDANVVVEEALGGASATYGGSGVVCWQAQVTVTRGATGGDGKRLGGQGLLQGVSSSVMLLGTAKDGQGSGSVPEKAASYGDLLRKLRDGETDITLAPAYKHGTATKLDKPWFVATKGTVTVRCAPTKKTAVLSGRVSLCGGSFVLEGLTIAPPTGEAALVAAADTQVQLKGSLTAKGAGLSILCADDAAAQVTGTLKGVACVTDRASLTVTGDIGHTAKSKSCLLVTDSAQARVVGDLTGQAQLEGSARLTVTGSLNGLTGTNALRCAGDAQAEITGDLSSKAKDAPTLSAADSASVRIDGSVTATAKTNAIVAEGTSTVTVTGSVSGGTSAESLPTVWQAGERVTIGGTVSGAVYTK